MKKKLIAMVIWVTVILWSGLVLADSYNDPFTIAIFPRRDAVSTVHLFTPLARYLERHLDRPVQLRTSSDFQSFMKLLETSSPDLVHLNQYQYVVLHERKGYQAIAQNEEYGRSAIRGAIYVRSNSPYFRLADLKGQKIVFGGGPDAMMSYILPTKLLRDAGLNEGDYQEDYAVNPPNAIFSLALHQAAAAGAGDAAIHLPMIKNRINVSDVRMLAASRPMSHLPWAVPADMDEGLRKKLQGILSGLVYSANGKSILTSAKLTAIIPAKDSDYNAHREVIREIRPNVLVSSDGQE